jgi:hypothetical protein
LEEQSATSPSAIARGHNVVHLLPADWAAIPAALGPALERVDVQAGSTQLLVIVADAEAAVGVSSVLNGVTAGNPRIVAATGADRTARILRAGAAPIVVGAPAQLVALLAASALKLDGLRTVVIAWVDEILAAGGTGALDALLADVPKDAYRVVITAELSPPVEDFIERHARRAPRFGLPLAAGVGVAAGPPAAGPPARPAKNQAGGAPPDGGPVSAIGYVLSAPSSRSTTLRRLLDETDPPSAAIFVRTDDCERDVRNTLETLGYHGSAAAVRVIRGTSTEHTALLVLYDIPLDTQEWRAASAASPARVVALVAPRQIAHLTRVTTLPARPLSLGAPAAAAHAREEILRGELRQELTNGTPTRELLTLEPLLTEFDGVALGAAALRLLERERAARVAAMSTVVSTAAPRSQTPADVRPPDRPQGRPHDRGGARGDRKRGDRPSPPRGDRDGGRGAADRFRSGPPRETRPLPRSPR